jgi:hypothetical protein
MKRRTRIQYTEADKALMWERWRQGESLHAIARLFNRYHPSIGGILSRNGGIRPRPRCRSPLALAAAMQMSSSSLQRTPRAMAPRLSERQCI